MGYKWFTQNGIFVKGYFYNKNIDDILSDLDKLKPELIFIHTTNRNITAGLIRAL